MATRQEFLAEINAQESAVREAIGQLDSSIAANDTTIDELEARRQDLLKRLAQSLLPDLQKGVLEALAARLPGFVTPEQVAQMIEDDRLTYQEQLKKLQVSYDPDKYEAEKLQLGMKVAEYESDLPTFRELVEEYASIPDLKRLIDAGYGFGGYQVRWWQGQYYRDWKAADLAIERTHVKDWQELREQWDCRTRNLSVIEGGLRDYQRRIADLEAKRASHRDLLKALDEAPENVLYKLHIKLEAHLNSLGAIPNQEWMGDIPALNARLGELDESNLNLKTSRSKMAEQLAGLQGMKLKVSRSKRSDVPDEYVQRFRSRRGCGGCHGTCGGTTVIYDDSWLLDMVLINEMTGFFSSGSHHDDGWSGSARDTGDSYSSPSARDLTTQS